MKAADYSVRGVAGAVMKGALLVDTILSAVQCWSLACLLSCELKCKLLPLPRHGVHTQVKVGQ